MNVLLATVGGSPPPIITHIERDRPDYVYFIASKTIGTNKSSRIVVDGNPTDRDGKPISNIVASVGFSKDEYEIIEIHPENPFKDYYVLYNLIEKLLKDKHLVSVNYSGGTKSMTAALFAAASEFPEVNISVTTGKREDLVQVKDGMERLSRLPRNQLYIQRQITSSKSLIKIRDYNAAHEVLDQLSTEIHVEHDIFDDLYYLTLGFDRWDKFEYADAMRYIDSYSQYDEILPYRKRLNSLVKTLENVENWTAQSQLQQDEEGFILVYDLLRNAERKADLKLYDDAVARIYRALEMYAQFCLFTNEPAFHTSNIEISQLPEEVQEHYEHIKQTSFKVSLINAYRLLQHLEHPIAEVWDNYENKIMDILQIRNFSYLAHGFKPVPKNEFIRMKEAVWEFIEKADKAMKFDQGFIDYPQLPDKLQFKGG